MDEYDCLDCGEQLQPVIYPPGSMLNEEQWASVRAGDYVCKVCPGDRGKSGMRYFWQSELEEAVNELTRNSP